MESNRQVLVSALDKIFPEGYTPIAQTQATVFENETFHFQVACYSPLFRSHIKMQIESDIKEKISVRSVELIPARGAYCNPCKRDDYYIKGHGNNELYPDLLRPFENGLETIREGMWTGYWITIDGTDGLPVGKHTITINVCCNDSAYNETSTFTLEVLRGKLPKADFTYTEWLHADCICETHRVEPFTKKFYKILKNYLKSAVSHGMNMLYTPLFTPALDVDGKLLKNYRKTVQLVGVSVGEGGEYIFNFEKVKEFMDFALSNGIEKFELCHLASQHGAKYSIKVMANVAGKEKRIFGWEKASDSEEYLTFLDAFLKEFALFLEENGYTEKVYFHVSDEPRKDSLTSFMPIRNLLVKHIKDVKIMDALSHKSFYEQGIITHPVVFLYEYEEFPADWVYYCGCAQDHYISNRLFVMPSQRTRIFGFQAYRNGTKGFLHWGFNFYHTLASHRVIDSYLISDRDVADSGDAYIVYPDVMNDGVLESLRHEVFADGLSDMRACYLLESLIGREKTIAFLDEQGIKAGYSEYPRSTKKHLLIRERLNKLIKRELAKRKE